MKNSHRLAHFIKVYDDVLTQEACDDIIKYFKCRTKEISGVENIGVVDEIRHADEMNVSTSNDEESQHIHNFLISATKKVMTWYKEDVSTYGDWVCDVENIESFRIKHYDIGEGYYKTHIDNVGGRQYAVIFYLNDVTIGGETEFPLINTMVNPKSGRVLIFPTTFMYPHQANIPLSNDKWMIQGYVVSG